MSIATLRGTRETVGLNFEFADQPEADANELIARVSISTTNYEYGRESSVSTSLGELRLDKDEFVSMVAECENWAQSPIG